MFGPLPPLYRMLVVLAALTVGVVSGIWMVHVTAVPALITAGIGWGALAGLLLTYVLLHDFHRQGRPVRVRHH